MQFRTQVPIPTFDHPIDYSSRIVSLGSCFAVNIGGKFQYFKFQNTTNPFGILFHPLALEKFIETVVTMKVFTEEDIFFHNDRWHSFEAHSDISHPDKSVVIERLNNGCISSRQELEAASHLIITLGTAWVYQNIDSAQVVANCHKVPQKQFKKDLLSVNAIVQSLLNIIQLLEKINPDLQIIFTISPVRHIKDGFVENQRSKSHLFSALHAVLDANPKLEYFPSYEIMMDELRDYRFYADDMLHPSQTAIDYIWQRFSDTHITAEAASTMKEIDGIQRGLSHRAFNAESPEHIHFLQNLKARIDAVQKMHPQIAF